MEYAYKVYQAIANNHIFWVGESLVLNGCVSQGATEAEAYAQLEESELAWLETADELGWIRPKNPIENIAVKTDIKTGDCHFTRFQAIQSASTPEALILLLNANERHFCPHAYKKKAETCEKPCGACIADWLKEEI